MLFTNNEKMERLQDFKPTSKVQLRQFCIWFTQGDVEKAKAMYDFYSEGVDLPDTDPVPPTKLQSVKATATEVMDFVRDNQDDLVSAVGFIKSLFDKGGVAQNVVEPLTKIN